jgi:thiol-disulfide isomerase/thioredoxin
MLTLLNQAVAEETIRTVITVSHQGKNFRLYRYTEYLSNKTELIEKQQADSTAKILLFRPKIKKGEWLLLANDAAKVNIFVRPGDSLYLHLSSPDSTQAPNMNGEPEVVPIFPDSLVAGENIHLLKFNNIMDEFYRRYAKQFNKPKNLRTALDSLKGAVMNAMPTNPDPGIKEHIRYSLAVLEDIVLPNKTFLYARYFKGSIKWRSPAYFRYLKTFFKDYLYSLCLETKGKKIVEAINISGNLDVLDSAFIKADTYKMNDTLRKIVILNGLQEIYFKKDFDRNKVERIIEQLKLKTRDQDLSVMAANILSQCWLLGKGASLPAIVFERASGKSFSTDSLKGQKTLIVFFATWSAESLQDLILFQKLEQKYGNKIKFISVMSEGDRNKVKQWKKEKNLTWDFYYDDKSRQAREKWHIQKTPHYLLLDQEGDVIKFDAPAPDENLELFLKNELKAARP